METPKLIMLLIYTGVCLASHKSYTIPVENYETELHNLGEHVEIPETPVRVIKITKTVAVKVPVPYPVKVIEKVPYPVHVNKPYPVPVPQIIKVPHAAAPNGVAEQHSHVGHGDVEAYQQPQTSYRVQEDDSNDNANPYNQNIHTFNGVEGNNYNAPEGEFIEEVSDNSYNEPAGNYYGHSDDQDPHNSLESKNYNVAIQNYLNNLNSNGPSHIKHY